MKFSRFACIALLLHETSARYLKEKKEKTADSINVYDYSRTEYQDHYLVGLLNYPNDAIPEILDNHTSGTYLDGIGGAPWDYVPRYE